MKNQAIIILLVMLSGGFVGTAQAQPAPRMRLIVVDASQSMDGEYIDDVRQDLFTLLQKDPPSKTSPVGIVLFAGSSEPVKWFRKKKPAMDFVNSIRADRGGTSIAAGLLEAIPHIKKYGKKVSVALTLYTDDQDSTPLETKSAVEQLSQLFASQQQKHLDQDVVIRSWSEQGTGAVIQSILAKNPGVTVRHTTEPVFLEAKLANPPQNQTYHASLTAEPTGSVRWDENDSQVAIYEIEWTVQTIGDPPITGTPYKFSLGLDNIRASQLHLGAREFNCTAPGTTKGRLELRVPITQDDLQTGKVSAHPILTTSLHSQPTGVDLYLTGSESKLPELPPPPPRETELHTVVTGVTSGVWYEVPNIAFYELTLEVTVDGPLPEGSRVQVESPPGVTRIKLRPDTLHEGSQSVSILMTAAVEPSPKQTSYSFKITPPQNTHLIHFIAPKPLEVQLSGPAPAHITSGGSLSDKGTFRANRFEAAATAMVPAWFQLDGPVTSRFARQLQLNVSGPNVNSFLGAVAPLQTVLMPLSIPPQDDPSYFIDSQDSQSIEVSPVNANGNVSAGIFQVEVLTFALFKKHLLIVLTILALIGGPWFVIRLVQSLKFTADDTEDPTGDDLPVNI